MRSETKFNHIKMELDFLYKISLNFIIDYNMHSSESSNTTFQFF